MGNSAHRYIVKTVLNDDKNLAYVMMHISKECGLISLNLGQYASRRLMQASRTLDTSLWGSGVAV